MKKDKISLKNSGLRGGGFREGEEMYLLHFLLLQIPVKNMLTYNYYGEPVVLQMLLDHSSQNP